MRDSIFSSPGQALGGLWQNIPRTIKLTFAATFIFGLLVHGYMLANFLVNHDGISYFAYFSPSSPTNSPPTLSSGRWLQEIAILFTGYIPTPWVTGLMSVLYLSITASIIVACLEIKRTYCAILIGLILATFPAAGVVFAYIQVADSIFLSILLACLSAYLSRKFRFGVIFGAILLALSLGIVQTYITFTAGLFLIMLILDTLSKKESAKTILLRGIKYAACLALGLILYFVILWLTLRIRDVSLTAYQGIDQMGRISLTELPSQIRTAYREFFTFFTQHPYWFLSARLQRVSRLIFTLPLILIPAMMALIAAKNWSGAKAQRESSKDRKRRMWHTMPYLCLLALFALLFPLAVNAIYIMGAHFIYLMLLYASVLVFVLLISLLDRLEVSLQGIQSSVKKHLGAFACWISLAVLLFAPYNYFVVLNGNYLQTDLALRQVYHISSTLAGRVRAFPGYEEGMPVVLVGHHSASSTMVMHQLSAHNAMVGFGTTNALINNPFAYTYFFHTFLGESLTLRFLRDEALREEHYEALSELAVFPAEGSMQVIDGMLFIRVSEDF
ncbi:MAG: glucosyltransferase domain-containing protein [Oscillospiraceae bacterium]|nr:glucosyltransferase domain-containing protein [Oscillospiraceae bacterium]